MKGALSAKATKTCSAKKKREAKENSFARNLLQDFSRLKGGAGQEKGENSSRKTKDQQAY